MATATASIEPAPIRAEELVQGTSLWKDAWYRLKKNHVALFGLYAFCVIALLCLVGPFFTGYTYEQTEISLKASAPMEPIASCTETRKTGEPRKSFIALSNLEDEFLDKPEADRKAIVAKIANGESYQEGRNTYRQSNQRHFFGTDPLGRDLLTRVFVGGGLFLAVGFSGPLVF